MYTSRRAVAAIALLSLALSGLHVEAHAQARLESAPATAGLHGRVTYFIADGAPGSQFRESDRELARWALAAWQHAVENAVTFVPATDATADIRIRWVPAGGGEYGETRPTLVNGRRGAMLFIRPDVDALGPDIARLADRDPLMRETIVYLTCLHELGHAMGLSHTADPQDVMYFFGYGGDIPAFFDRYRRQLHVRADIARVPGLSAHDIARARGLSASQR
jgi:hypothetical protein